jgi:hypothetical protein
VKVIITGGTLRKTSSLTKDWSAFSGGKLLIYDTVNKKVVHDFQYETPLEHKPKKDSSILFKASYLDKNILYIATKTEILTYCIETFTLLNVFSHPLMNDVHHVSLIKSKLYVVSTGIDSVLVFSLCGKFETLHYIADGCFEDRFSRDEDYRKIESLKPHASHPNYVFEYKNDIYVTRFMQKDCYRLRDNAIFSVADNFIHDGVPYHDSVYFTAVDGQLIITNLAGRKETISLNIMERSKIPLGWCRSVLPIDTCTP